MCPRKTQGLRLFVSEGFPFSRFRDSPVFAYKTDIKRADYRQDVQVTDGLTLNQAKVSAPARIRPCGHTLARDQEYQSQFHKALLGPKDSNVRILRSTSCPTSLAPSMRADMRYSSSLPFDTTRYRSRPGRGQGSEMCASSPADAICNYMHGSIRGVELTDRDLSHGASTPRHLSHWRRLS